MILSDNSNGQNPKESRGSSSKWKKAILLPTDLRSLHFKILYSTFKPTEKLRNSILIFLTVFNEQLEELPKASNSPHMAQEDHEWSIYRNYFYDSNRWEAMVKEFSKRMLEKRVRREDLDTGNMLYSRFSLVDLQFSLEEKEVGELIDQFILRVFAVRSLVSSVSLLENLVNNAGKNKPKKGTGLFSFLNPSTKDSQQDKNPGGEQAPILDSSTKPNKESDEEGVLQVSAPQNLLMTDEEISENLVVDDNSNKNLNDDSHILTDKQKKEEHQSYSIYEDKTRPEILMSLPPKDPTNHQNLGAITQNEEESQLGDNQKFQDENENVNHPSYIHSISDNLVEVKPEHANKDEIKVNSKLQELFNSRELQVCDNIQNDPIDVVILQSDGIVDSNKIVNSVLRNEKKDSSEGTQYAIPDKSCQLEKQMATISESHQIYNLVIIDAILEIEQILSTPKSIQDNDKLSDKENANKSFSKQNSSQLLIIGPSTDDSKLMIEEMSESVETYKTNSADKNDKKILGEPDAEIDAHQCSEQNNEVKPGIIHHHDGTQQIKNETHVNHSTPIENTAKLDLEPGQTFNIKEVDDIIVDGDLSYPTNNALVEGDSFCQKDHLVIMNKEKSSSKCSFSEESFMSKSDQEDANVENTIGSKSSNEKAYSDPNLGSSRRDSRQLIQVKDLPPLESKNEIEENISLKDEFTLNQQIKFDSFEEPSFASETHEENLDISGSQSDSEITPDSYSEPEIEFQPEIKIEKELSIKFNRSSSDSEPNIVEVDRTNLHSSSEPDLEIDSFSEPEIVFGSNSGQEIGLESPQSTEKETNKLNPKCEREILIERGQDKSEEGVEELLQDEPPQYSQENVIQVKRSVSQSSFTKDEEIHDLIEEKTMINNRKVKEDSLESAEENSEEANNFEQGLSNINKKTVIDDSPQIEETLTKENDSELVSKISNTESISENRESNHDSKCILTSNELETDLPHPSTDSTTLPFPQKKVQVEVQNGRVLNTATEEPRPSSEQLQIKAQIPLKKKRKLLKKKKTKKDNTNIAVKASEVIVKELKKEKKLALCRTKIDTATMSPNIKKLQVIFDDSSYEMPILKKMKTRRSAKKQSTPQNKFDNIEYAKKPSVPRFKPRKINKIDKDSIISLVRAKSKERAYSRNEGPDNTKFKRIAHANSRIFIDLKSKYNPKIVAEFKEYEIKKRESNIAYEAARLRSLSVIHHSKRCNPFVVCTPIHTGKKTISNRSYSKIHSSRQVLKLASKSPLCRKNQILKVGESDLDFQKLKKMICHRLLDAKCNKNIQSNSKSKNL